MPATAATESPIEAGIRSLRTLTQERNQPEARSAQVSISFGESVPTALLRSTWAALSARHDSLQSGFRFGKSPARIFHGDAAPAWSELDWSELPAGEVRERWAGLLAAEAANPPEESMAPPLRFVAIRLPGGSTHVLATHPRFFLNEEAWFFLLCEWIEALGGAPPPAEGEAAEIGTSTEAGDWWGLALKDASPHAIARFPLEATPTPSEQTFLLEREDTQALRVAATRAGGTLRDLVIGLWGGLLARHSLREDAIVLTTIEPETPQGARENILPCRVAVPQKAALGTWLKVFSNAETQRRRTARVALDDLPEPFSRGGAAASLVFWRPPSLADRIQEANPRWINLDARFLAPPIHGLELEIRDGPRMTFRLRADCISPREARHLLERFEDLLQVLAVQEDPASFCLDAWPIPGFRSLPRPPSDPPSSSASLEDVLTDFADSSGASSAVEDATGGALTYSEVHDYAQRVASFLVSENLGHGWTCGICLLPSTWVPVAILGTIYAQNTFLPLDPEAAPEWLAARLEAADAEFILCDSATHHRFANFGKRLIVLDQEWEAISATEKIEKSEAAPPRVAVYLPGTRNSPPPLRATLTPAQLMAGCHRAIKGLGIAPGERVQVASPAGSAEALESLLCALMSGATAVIGHSGTSQGISAAHPSHLRLTRQEFSRWVAGHDGAPWVLPEGLRSVRVEADGLGVAGQDIEKWNSGKGAGGSWLQFFSPNGLCSMGLILKLEQGASPAESDGHLTLGVPARFSGVSFEDLTEQIPPPGYPANLIFRAPYSSEEPWKAPAWQDAEGNFYLVTNPFPEIPSQPEEEAASASASASQESPTPETAASDTHYPGDEAASASKPPPAPLVSLGGEPISPALFIMHDLEGSTAFAAKLLSRLTADWQVFGTTLGESRRDTPRDPCAEAARIATAIRQFQPGQPTHLLGLGYGGLVAFEVAARLRAASADVPFLVIAGTPPPSLATQSWFATMSRSLSNVLRGASSLDALAATLVTAPLEGPCVVFLTSDLPAHAGQRWQKIAPDSVTETLACLSEEISTSGSSEFLRAFQSLWQNS